MSTQIYISACTYTCTQWLAGHSCESQTWRCKFVVVVGGGGAGGAGAGAGGAGAGGAFGCGGSGDGAATFKVS